MKIITIAATAVFVALSVPVFAQDQPAPKASLADVQKVVASIKADPAKQAQFCALMRMQDESQTASEKKDDKKVEELDGQMEAAANKLGPDFLKIWSAELDEASGNALDGLADGCK